MESDETGDESFNERALMDRLAGDRAQAIHLIEMFVELGEENRQELAAAVAGEDADDISEKAHKLKGSLLYVHANQTLRLAKELEELRTSGSMTERRALFAELETAWPQLRHDLAEFSQRLKAGETEE